MGLINEAKTDLPVRSVVRDIINVVKSRGVKLKEHMKPTSRNRKTADYPQRDKFP